jgi:hypothetical protein
MITYMHVEENTDTTTDTYTKSTGIKGLITTLDVQCMIVTQAAGVERGKKYDTPGTYKYISAIPIAYSPLQRHLPPRHSAQTRPPMPTYKTYPSPPAHDHGDHFFSCRHANKSGRCCGTTSSAPKRHRG